MEYLMQHPHETIMYSSNKIFKVNKIPINFLFKESKSEINQTQ